MSSRGQGERMTEEEEDWQKYASSGFGSTDLDLWNDLEVVEVEEEKPEIVESELPQLNTHLQEIPPAPAPDGLKHMVRIGICDYCLGRLGGRSTVGQELSEVGASLRIQVEDRDVNMKGAREKEPWCPFCENLFEEAKVLAELIADGLSEHEFDRLQLGAQFPKDQTENEDQLRKRFGATGSAPLKSSLMDEVARCLRASQEGINLVNDKPQILALIDLLTLNVNLDIRSHYVYGRYRKLERGIPQTRWPCRSCKGRGCAKCSGSGMQYPNSVQALVGDPLLDLYESSNHAFHGMGREDIDVRCLGRGRPFIIELKNPRKRKVPMQEVMDAINKAAEGKIEVDSMRDSQRSEVVRVKDTPAEKSYRICFTVLPLNNEDETDLSSLKKAELEELCIQRGIKKGGKKADLIERLQAVHVPDAESITKILLGMEGTVLEQRTPKRVAHRRADKVRKRRVMEASNVKVEMNDGVPEVQVDLRCESGTYVKETVHGDDGRTVPSVAGLLQSECKVLWLDVADIHAD